MKEKHQKNTKKTLAVLSAPSGGGKTTIVRRLLEDNSSFGVSISCTTRRPRKGEEDGVHYYFLSESEFRAKIAEGGFVEWAEVHGHLYGTPVTELERLWALGKQILFDIDVQGGINIKKKYPDNTLLIFISPPDFQVLEQRLRSRGTDDEKTVEKRLKNGIKETNIAKESYDNFVVNDDLDSAVADVERIIRSFRQT